MTTSPPTLRILPELLHRRGLFVFAAVLLSLVSVAAGLALPLIVRELVIAISEGSGVRGPVLTMGALAAVGALCSAASTYLLSRVGEGMVLRLRSRLVDHILRLPLHTTRRVGQGNLVARVTADATQLRSLVDVGVAQLPTQAIALVATLAIMAWLDWVLLAITVGSFALAAGGIAFVVRAVRHRVVRQQTAIGRLAQGLTSALAALPAIKAYRAADRTGERICGSAREAADASISAARLQSLVGPTVELGQQAALIGVVVGSGARLASGNLAIPEFAAFLMYLFQLIAPLTVVAMGVSRLQTGLAARNRLGEVLDLPTEREHPTSAPDVRPDATAVRFSRVGCAYGQEDVLREVSFTVPNRGLTALVGPSGAGKTTMLNLIEGFLTPSSGTVEILGHGIDDWPLPELRRRVTYVDQAFTLVEGTVRENLSMGRDTAPTDAELHAALDEVGMRADVLALPDGLDTMLGRETDLSGGQRQRIALARALLTPSDIVLLDEPTSQLDSVNERRLRDVVQTLARDRAVLVVAHRISTVQQADQVVLVDSGRVVDTGDHHRLLERCAPYRDLVTGQLLVGEPLAAA